MGKLIGGAPTFSAAVFLRFWYSLRMNNQYSETKRLSDAITNLAATIAERMRVVADGQEQMLREIGQQTENEGCAENGGHNADEDRNGGAFRNHRSDAGKLDETRLCAVFEDGQEWQV